MSAGRYTNHITRTIASIMKDGPKQTFKRWWTIHDAKVGTLVGEDRFGNKYYENLEEELGRDRWVEYKQWAWPGPSDQVTAEWHGWLHKMNDSPGLPEAVKPKYLQPFTPNLTGSPAAYKPYNTTRSKIEAWTPSAKQR